MDIARVFAYFSMDRSKRLRLYTNPLQISWNPKIGESSNGRTPDSDSGYLGSNPGGATSMSGASLFLRTAGGHGKRTTPTSGRWFDKKAMRAFLHARLDRVPEGRGTGMCRVNPGSPANQKGLDRESDRALFRWLACKRKNAKRFVPSTWISGGHEGRSVESRSERGPRLAGSE
jgi:hypothetical protein